MMKRLIERILCAYCGLSVEDGLSPSVCTHAEMRPSPASGRA